MNEDLVVRTTVDFIRSSSKNLDLALQIEEAIPRLKEELIKEFLESVKSAVATDEWRSHWSDPGLFEKYAWLTLRRADWPSDEDPTGHPTGILLSTDKAYWGIVYVGIYFSEVTLQRIKTRQQHILPELKQAWEKLPQGRGWQTIGFPGERLVGLPNYATYRRFDEPLGDWSSARFLRNSLDGDRREDMVNQVVSRMEFLKCPASALVEATLP